MSDHPSAESLPDRLGARLFALWAGLSIGVAFLATPAKFLAPSLSLPVALDVGRHTFSVYGDVELGLVVVLLGLGVWSGHWRRWGLALSVPIAVVALQALWLTPALDARVSLILSGNPRLPRSILHQVFIGAEMVKVAWLLAMGLGDLPGARRGA